MRKGPSRTEQLETELRLATERVAELKRDLDEAHELITEMRERLELIGENRQEVIEALGMMETEPDVWQVDPESFWTRYDELLTEHDKLVREWNKFFPKYNRDVAPLSRGRPLAASYAQQEEVRKRRKRGESLRGIAAATGLGLGTVRSILRGKERVAGLRKREFDKHRAREFRARKRLIDFAPKKLTEEAQEVARLITASKGLGSA